MRRRILSLLFGLVLLGVPLVASADSSYTFTYECADPSGPAVVLCDVYLDADIHGGSYGTILAHHTSAGKRTITAAIPTGSHRISIRADAKVSGGTNTSVFVINWGSTCQSGWAMVGYQAWWADTGQHPAFGSRHAHIDNLCIPVNNKIVNGVQTFNFQVQLHKQPPGARLTRVRINDQPSSVDIWKQTTGLTQPNASGNMTQQFSVPINLSNIATGRREWRFGVYVLQPNGKVQLLSSRTQICVRSCSPAYRSLSAFPILQGNGAWYWKDTDPGYVDARVRSSIPAN